MKVIPVNIYYQFTEYVLLINEKEFSLFLLQSLNSVLLLKLQARKRFNLTIHNISVFASKKSVEMSLNKTQKNAPGQ